MDCICTALHCTALHTVIYGESKYTPLLVFSYTIYPIIIYISIHFYVYQRCVPFYWNISYITLVLSHVRARTVCCTVLLQEESILFFVFFFFVFCFLFFEGWVHCHIVCPMSDCMFLTTMNRAVSYQAKQWAANNVFLCLGQLDSRIWARF